MGLFDHIQKEIEDREKRDGITLAELLDLSPPVRRMMNRITREGELTAKEAGEHIDVPLEQAQEMLNSLVEKGYLDREKREEEWVYKIRFARKRGRALPPGIWSALGERDEDE
jgi:DNA-binding MarR family transcriptional regulator